MSIEQQSKTNSPFSSFLKPLSQTEAWCTTIHIKMSLTYMWMKSHFHMKGRAPRVALSIRLKVIRKWRINALFMYQVRVFLKQKKQLYITSIF